MNIDRWDILDESQVERLRQLAHQGKSVPEIVHAMRAAIAPGIRFQLITFAYLRAAFNLNLKEVMEFQYAQCMDGAAVSDEELDSALRPLILERLAGLEMRPDVQEGR